MLRTALRPRWLALLVLVLLAATGMSMLGRWQLDRAREHAEQNEQRQATQETGDLVAAARPIEQVLQPRTTFPKSALGAAVTATGTWDGERRLLVADRELDGRTGFWVLVPLRLADGSAVGIVRGWVPGPDSPGAQPPSGTATVTGWLEPTEPPVARDPGQGTGLPAGQLRELAVTDLVNQWPYPLITGFVLAGTEDPATGPATPQRIPPSQLHPGEDTGLDWKNVAYAFQWWLFAAFGLFMWWRLVRDATYPQERPPPPVGQDDTEDQKQGAAL